VIRRLVGLAGGGLVTVGLALEDLVDPPPVTAGTDSCLRCRGNVVTTAEELSALLLRAASGEALNRVARDVEQFRRIEVAE
jgi:hypothetical protein